MVIYNGAVRAYQFLESLGMDCGQIKFQLFKHKSVFGGWCLESTDIERTEVRNELNDDVG